MLPPTAMSRLLLASHARYGARFTQPGFVNGWGIAIRPAGAGGHFWIGGGGTSWQFIGDVARSADPGMRALHQDGLREVAVPRSDALTGDDSAGKVTGVVYNGAPWTRSCCGSGSSLPPDACSRARPASSS